MPSTLPILRARRERRLARQQTHGARRRNIFLSFGMIISLGIAVLIFGGALAYINLTRDLPSIQTLPILLNPPNGLLLQPTRIYDRTRQHVLYTFATDSATRRYIPLNPANPQHLPPALANAVIANTDPTFYEHPGYTLETLTNYQLHPTLAQTLAHDLLLFNELPSLRRALRERILAAQITAEFGRTQVLEWYLNSAYFGRNAFGAESAAQLYFGKPAAQLTTAEAAILAVASDSPSLNPHDAPQTALERGRDTIEKMYTLGLLSSEATANALGESPTFQAAPLSQPEPAPAFVNLLLTQADSLIPRERLQRGGITIISTLDFETQRQASCLTAFYAARLVSKPDPRLECETLRYLTALPPGVSAPDSSASALITDPRNGQVLAVVGETFQAQETPLVGGHKPGSALDAFVFLTGFTRGLSPASLVWDIPGRTEVQNFDGVYHGPIRLRTALANDYPAPAAQVLAQMGVESLTAITSSFGVSRESDLTLMNAAGAYGVFAQSGVYFGQELNGTFQPVTMIRVEGNDGSLWLDWGTPQAKPVVTPALAYLVNHSLSDATAFQSHANLLNVERPAALKLGQTADGADAWAIGYSPLRVVSVWVGSRSDESLHGADAGVLWNALLQAASQDLPRDGWLLPAGVSVINVCDPSGMLPTSECPNVVNEVFLQGNEPVQADTMYRKYSINRETGLLATVFTLPQLVEDRVYLVAPADARAWAESAGVEIPPTNYDVIQTPPLKADVNITSPELFSEVSGVVQINGTAAGADFVSYRVLVGQGLNPQEWLQIGEGNAPVLNSLLSDWNTDGLSGLYVIQLQVVRVDQKVDTAMVQVTVNP